MSLNTEEGENTEQNEMKELKEQLNETKDVVQLLSKQLSELRDKVSSCNNNNYAHNLTKRLEIYSISAVNDSQPPTLAASLYHVILYNGYYDILYISYQEPNR